MVELKTDKNTFPVNERFELISNIFSRFKSSVLEQIFKKQIEKPVFAKGTFNWIKRIKHNNYYKGIPK